MAAENRFVLTGAPGSGKSTVLGHLGALGFGVVEEPAREVLAEQRRIDGRGTYDRDPRLFVELMTARAVREHESLRDSRAPVFFDRGVPDNVVYATLFELDAEPTWHAARGHRYADPVFHFPSWPEIYRTDDERTMSFEAARRFGDLARDTYERLGYALVHVPRASGAERARFILDALPPR